MSELNVRLFLESLVTEEQKRKNEQEVLWLINEITNEVENGFHLDEVNEKTVIQFLSDQYVRFAKKIAKLETEQFLGLIDNKYQEDGWMTDFGHNHIYKDIIKEMLIQSKEQKGIA